MKKLVIIILSVCVLFTFTAPVIAKTHYKVAWSHYTGWEPWEFANHAGILKKWADKYGIEIELSKPMDYINSINVFTQKQYDACVMTNMDQLMIPAVAGADSTAIIIGDFSNGNDGIVIKNGSSVKDLKGRGPDMKIVLFSVSHYLLARAIDMNGMTEKDLGTIPNTKDEKLIPSLLLSDEGGIAITWNPFLIGCRQQPGAKLIFDSSQIPGEIIDMLVVRTGVADEFKKALTGAWYETMAVMSSRGNSGKKAIQYMADYAGGSEDEFRAQLRTTAMFYKASNAVEFTNSEKLKQTMDYVRKFVFSHGQMGDADSVDYVGIQFPDKSVLGDKGNIKMRFDSTYMQMAVDGKL